MEGHDPEVVGQRGKTGAVVEALADLEALEVASAGRLEVAALRVDGTHDLQCRRDTKVVTRGTEPLDRPIEQPERLVVSSDAAHRLGQRVVAARQQASVTQPIGHGPGLEHDLFGTRDLANQLEDVGEGDRRIDPIRPIDER
jgi:hypothetical protein